MFVGILLLFSLGPNIPLYKQSLREELVGAGVATSSWLVAAVVGSWIISKVPHLHAAYGSISAVVVLMLWMLISAYCLLLGAAVAAVLTEQRLQPELPELE
jgi:membrane protein